MSSCCGCGCKKKCPPKTIFKLWEGSFSLTTPIDPVTFVPPVSSATTNAVFLVDASDPASTGTISGASVGDVTGDGNSNSALDVSLQAVEDIIRAWQAQGTSNDVNIQVFSFETQLLGDVPEYEPATPLSDTPLNLTSSIPAAIAAFNARPEEFAFGDNNSMTFDQGAAIYEKAFEAANDWLATQPQGAETTNLIYVLTASTGFDTGMDYIDASIPGFGQDGTLDGHIDVNWFLPNPDLDGVVNSDMIEQVRTAANTYGAQIEVLYYGNISSIPFNSPLYPLPDFNNFALDTSQRQALFYGDTASFITAATGDLPA